MRVLLSTTYCGPIQWYQKLHRSEEALLECHETFQKQTYRNRCVIATTNGLQTLTVPVERGTSPFIRDIRISNHGNWRHQHWHALMSAYNESPFFDYYQDDFRPFFEQHYDFLYDFNTEICRKVCELIDIQPNIRETSFYRNVGVLELKGVKGNQRPLPSDATNLSTCQLVNLSTESPSLREGLGVGPSSLISHPSSKIRSADNSLKFSGSKDLITSQPESTNLSTRQLVNSSTELSSQELKGVKGNQRPLPSDATNLSTCQLVNSSTESPSLREGLGVGSSSLIPHLSSNPIDLRSAINPKHPAEDIDFLPRRYYQVYERKHGFQPNLSILDLLFNMGPESVFWL